MHVELQNYTPLNTATHAMGQCYGKELTEDALIRATSSGHLSLLEHTLVTFDIEMSQKCLAQITRHRHLSFTVKSTRGTDFGDATWFDSTEHPEITDDMGQLMNKLIENQILEYRRLVDAGVPYQVASYVLPLATNVTMTVSGSLRTWMEYLPKRLCKRASTEHQQVARAIFERLNYLYPSLVNLQTLGMCESCKEVSCDFTTHKKKQKTPVRAELQHINN